MAITENRLSVIISGTMNATLRIAALSTQLVASTQAAELVRRGAIATGEVVAGLFGLQRVSDDQAAQEQSQQESFLPNWLKTGISSARTFVLTNGAPFRDRTAHPTKTLIANVAIIGVTGLVLHKGANYLCGPTHPAYNQGMGLFTNFQIHDDILATSWSNLFGRVTNLFARG